MGYIKVFYHPFLKKGAYGLAKTMASYRPSVYKLSKFFFAFVARGKNSVGIKNLVLFCCLCGIPIGANLINDSVVDHVAMERGQGEFQKSLTSSAEHHAGVLYGLKNKIILEKLYKNKQGMQKLLVDIISLKPFAKQSSLQSIKGLRWISPDLKSIGLYGEVHNFNPKLFLPFLRSLDQDPNNIQLIAIDEMIYFGIGVVEGQEIKGYLLAPFPLESLLKSPPLMNLKLFQTSSKITLPFSGISLNTFIKMPFSYVQVYKSMNWRTCGLENGLAFILLILFAFFVLLLKRKIDLKKEVEVSRFKNKIQCLSQNLQAQQKVANLIIHRLHEVSGSIGEISNILLETHSTSDVLSEQDKINFIRKIYNATLALDKNIIQIRAQDQIDLKGIIKECLHFYGSKIEESQIYVRENYDFPQLSFCSDENSFTQLMLNLIHMVLERTPEQGEIVITAIKPAKADDGLCIVMIEDNGYAFSFKELKNFQKPVNAIFEKYFDLEWERILELARNLRCQVSCEKISPIGNRIILTIYEHKVNDQEALYDQYEATSNIIRLFPSP